LIEIVEDRIARQPAVDLTRQERKFPHKPGVMIEAGGHPATLGSYFRHLSSPKI